MLETTYQLKISYKAVIFLILLESLTVPWVAYFNDLARQALIFMLSMGFLVAFFMVIILFKLLKAYIIKQASKFFKLKLLNITGLWYIGVIAGILELIMFAVQNIMFSMQFNAGITGFVSAFISVLISLLIYKVLSQYYILGIKLIGPNLSGIFKLQMLDILKGSSLLGFYELLVCPITGAWIPYLGVMRIAIAIISAVIGGVSGGILILLLNRYFSWFKINFVIAWSDI